MEESIKDRLIFFRDNCGVRPGEFEKRIEVSKGYVKGLKGEIASSVLKRIKSEFPFLSLDWLITGEGDMIISEKKSIIISDLKNSFSSNFNDSQTILKLLEMIEKSEQEKDKLQEELTMVRAQLNHCTARLKESSFI